MEENNTQISEFKETRLVTTSPDQQRIISEVQGAIIVAKRCPRNEQKAFTEIINACKRPSLAEQALYAFPRGGQVVRGPSIRLAEVIARNWGNLQYGIREIETDGDSTKYEAFCWDVQNNVRSSRIFSKKHGRWTKKNGFTAVEDPRDKYEVVASDAARRLRTCILDIVPGDLVDEATAQIQKTLAGKTDTPIKDRIRKMVSAFEPLGVSESMIKDHLGHSVEATDEVELRSLLEIYNSIKDGQTGRKEWFVIDEDENLNEINERFKDVTNS
jgi:hypothetical protein